MGAYSPVHAYPSDFDELSKIQASSANDQSLVHDQSLPSSAGTSILDSQKSEEKYFVLVAFGT